LLENCNSIYKERVRVLKLGEDYIYLQVFHIY